MNDQQIWDKGLQFVEKLFAGLPVPDRQLLSAMLANCIRKKQDLASIFLQVESETACKECLGQCCLNGKYRMSVFDLLSLCAAGVKVVPDFSKKPLCPYGNAVGCSLELAFRPLGCVFFLCETLDERLPVLSRAALVSCEESIRECRLKVSRILDIPLATPLLLWAEKINT